MKNLPLLVPLQANLSLHLQPLVGSLWLPRPSPTSRAWGGISIVSAPLTFFLNCVGEFCTLYRLDPAWPRFLSTQLPRIPEVGQHAPPSLSKLPDYLGCGQADVSNLH